jgi:hypothetical protein
MYQWVAVKPSEAGASLGHTRVFHMASTIPRAEQGPIWTVPRGWNGGCMAMWTAMACEWQRLWGHRRCRAGLSAPLLRTGEGPAPDIGPSVNWSPHESFVSISSSGMAENRRPSALPQWTLAWPRRPSRNSAARRCIRLAGSRPSAGWHENSASRRGFASGSEPDAKKGHAPRESRGKAVGYICRIVISGIGRYSRTCSRAADDSYGRIAPPKSPAPAPLPWVRPARLAPT